jgi:hypothetical protein
MTLVSTLGIDLAKSTFSLHAVNLPQSPLFEE